MYRVLLLLFLLSAVECCGHSRFCRHNRRFGSKFHHHFHRHGVDRSIKDIAYKLQRLDAAFYNICQQNENRTTETYGMDYILKYSLPEYVNPNITIKTNYRVIYTTVEAEGMTFNDIRILPNILNLDKAGWVFGDGELKVVIPYAIKIGEENEVKCDSVDTSIPEWRDVKYKIQLRSAIDIDVRSFAKDPLQLPEPF